MPILHDQASGGGSGWGPSTRLHDFSWAHRCLAAPAACCIRRSNVRALLPLLVDLDGWQGDKADGMSMEMPGNSMTSAKRDYRRGTSQLQVTVLMGPAAAGALAPTRTAMNVETSEGHVITTTLNDFPVTETYNIPQKSGALLIALGSSALLTISYNGISEDDALTLAKKFDWKAIRAATQK